MLRSYWNLKRFFTRTYIIPIIPLRASWREIFLVELVLVGALRSWHFKFVLAMIWCGPRNRGSLISFLLLDLLSIMGRVSRDETEMSLVKWHLWVLIYTFDDRNPFWTWQFGRSRNTSLNGHKSKRASHQINAENNKVHIFKMFTPQDRVIRRCYTTKMVATRGDDELYSQLWSEYSRICRELSWESEIRRWLSLKKDDMWLINIMLIMTKRRHENETTFAS